MKNKHKIIIVDDHPIFLDGLTKILSVEPDFEIVGIYNNGVELLHALNMGSIDCPDLIVLDIQMPIQNGMDVLNQIKSDGYSTVKALFITMFENSNITRNVKKSGANGLLPKTTDATIVKETIRKILEGKDVFVCDKSEITNEDTNMFYLSKREIEIINQIKKGSTSKEIARELHVSIYTVETHRKNIFRKLKVKSVSELVAFAYENKL